jgi:hypothetical protein
LSILTKLINCLNGGEPFLYKLSMPMISLPRTGKIGILILIPVFKQIKEGIIEKYIGTESSIIDDIESAGFTVESCFSIPIGGGMLEITAKKN